MKIHLTDSDFSQMATELCNQIRPIKDKFQWVVGISRGGLPLSNWLAYALGKNHTSIRISFYEGEGTLRSTAIWDDRWCPTFDKAPFLLVDDIVDSGKTIRHFREVASNGATFWTAALHWCPENSPGDKPDFYAKVKRKDDWIVYPWEENKS